LAYFITIISINKIEEKRGGEGEKGR